MVGVRAGRATAAGATKGVSEKESVSAGTISGSTIDGLAMRVPTRAPIIVEYCRAPVPDLIGLD